jgi:hypothetical protein
MDISRFKNSLEKNDLLRFFVLFFLIFLAHSNLLFPPYAENPDANTIFPVLEGITSPWDYISKLVSFETLDFQPVRDLTLYLDIWFFDLTGRIGGIFLNCLIWVVAMWQLLRIMEERYTLERLNSLLLICCFSVYPIFTQSLNWGIARKHLLAFTFTLMATRYFFRWLKEKKGEFKVLIFYTLSVLSLPASMLYPVWVTCVIFLTKERSFRESKKFLSLLFLLMVLLVGINWAYYKTSFTFLSIYPRKASELDILYTIFHLGHHIRQILFPYKLSFYYSFDGTSIAGFLGLLIFLIWLLWKKRSQSEIWIWVLYAGAHLVVLLSTPNVYFDTYVLHPALGVFFITFLLVRKHLDKMRILLITLGIFWTGYTLHVNPVWGDSVAFFRMSFENQRSCGNAIGYGAAQYLKGKKISNELFEYIQVNRCLDHSPEDSPFMALKKNNFEALQLYYEDEIDFDYRQKRLIDLGLKHFYAMSVYVAFLARHDKAIEIERVSAMLNEKFRGSGVSIAYDKIFSSVVPDYCKKNNLPECIKFSSLWKGQSRKSYDVY